MANNVHPKLEENEPAGVEDSSRVTVGIRFAIAALILFVLAAVFHFGMGPYAERLPDDYANSITMLENNRFRSSSADDWQTNSLDVKRIDQVISNSGNVIMIEGGLHIYDSSGGVNFEATGLYGVDRNTRVNLPGYGDTERNGQYLFPPHVKPGTYTLWDPMFIGARQTSFVQSDIVDGLQVFVFQFTAIGLDETAGYSYLADVPERYFVNTDGKGTAWVEPISGIIVDYEDSGVSYFVEKATGVRSGDFNQWDERFTSETKAAQLIIARLALTKSLILETWLPFVLLLAGLVCLGLSAAWFLRRKHADLPVIGEQA